MRSAGPSQKNRVAQSFGFVRNVETLAAGGSVSAGSGLIGFVCSHSVAVPLDEDDLAVVGQPVDDC
jgi:hypothetical protein